MYEHPFPPVYDENSKIFILGSFPSIKSREQMFFYGHPQNRFWKVMSRIFNTAIGSEPPDKRRFLLSHGIALWDVIASCDIKGSADSSIKNAAPNDIGEILRECNINKIFVNGKTAKSLYDRKIMPKVSQDAICLPSTSPANAAYSLDKLVSEWMIIKNWIE